MSLEEIQKVREEKGRTLKESGAVLYPPISERTHTVADALEHFVDLASQKMAITLVGRIMLMRPQGGSCFFHFQDGSGKVQGYAKKDILGEAAYKQFTGLFDIGDIAEFSGIFFETKKGERTLEVKSVRMLAKSMLPLPEKWHGLTDTEERFRKRYLDLLMNDEVRQRFVVRSKIVQATRDFFLEAGFLEVETPILHTIAGGALATPFKTKMETLDLDLYMRVAPELYLKRLIVGGFEKVFEMGKSFRNEGMDRDHNPEFTEPEAYIAYKDYEWLMGFTENLFLHIINAVFKQEHAQVPFSGQELEFAAPWPRLDLNDLVKQHTGLDFWDNSAEDYLKKAQELGIKVEKIPTKSVLFDELFKKVARPKLQNPVFVVNHPLELSPLAKAHRDDPRKVERFQLVVGGMEVANAFSELNDPMEQKRRFQMQETDRKAGDSDAHRMDEDYIEALSYGMPPAAGIGIGLDRVVRLLTDSATLREVLLFPTMKPKHES